MAQIKKVFELANTPKKYEYVIYYQIDGASGIYITIKVNCELTYFPIKIDSGYSDVVSRSGWGSSFKLNNDKISEIEQFIKSQGASKFELIVGYGDSMHSKQGELKLKQLPEKETTLSLNKIRPYTHVKFIYSPDRSKVSKGEISEQDFKICKITNKSVKWVDKIQCYFITFEDEKSSHIDTGYVYLKPDLTVRYGKYSIWSIDSLPIDDDPKDVYSKFQLVGNDRLLKTKEILGVD